jgi:hypothetical protein
MKTSMEIRMQCVSLANTLACGKNIQPKDVIPQAMEYLKWIEGMDEPAGADDVARLAHRFGRR